ncbi:MAG: TVP38/TMEM64 family protein [Pseudomonadota bacterium]
MSDPVETQTPQSKRGLIVRFIPLAVILVGIVAVFASGAHRYLSIAALRENYDALQAFVAANRLAALGIFAVVYIAVTALSIPGAIVLSLSAGLLFGTVIGTPLAVVSATIGASIIFFAARTSLGALFEKYGAKYSEPMRRGFNENAFSYLLILRLVPLFPFFVVNLVPAFLGVRFPVFFFATLIGIVPGAFAYVSAGNGVGAVLRAGGEVKLSGLLTQPAVLVPIVALSLLAILPVAYKRFVRGTKVDPATEADAA